MSKFALSKKIFICALGLSCVTTPVVFAEKAKIKSTKEAHKIDTKPKSTVIGDWTLVCQNDNSCVLSQVITSPSKEKEGQSLTLAMYQFSYVKTEKGKQLKFAEILPPNVTMAPGTALVDKSGNIFLRATFLNCTASACTAIVDVSDSDLALLKKSPELSVAYFSADQKQVNVALSGKGLDEALKALVSKFKK